MPRRNSPWFIKCFGLEQGRRFTPVGVPFLQRGLRSSPSILRKSTQTASPPPTHLRPGMWPSSLQRIPGFCAGCAKTPLTRPRGTPPGCLGGNTDLVCARPARKNHVLRGSMLCSEACYALFPLLHSRLVAWMLTRWRKRHADSRSSVTD
jgi:hypothetical protein